MSASSVPMLGVLIAGHRSAEEEGDSPDEDREADEPAHEHGPEEDAVRDAKRARGEAGDVEERVQRDGEHEEEQPCADGLTDQALQADVDGVAGEELLLNAPDRVSDRLAEDRSERRGQ